ncbi:unnamed protein product [Linum tenue]|nr:unnamed protein product [Linum tenue]
MERFISLRVMVTILSLLLALQFQQIYASGSNGIQSRVCGADRISYSNSVDDGVFLINGSVVEIDSLCKALRFHIANGCIPAEDYLVSLCQSGSSLGNSHHKPARKLLQKEFKEEVAKEQKAKDPSNALSSKHIGIIATGIVAMCCGVLCPCIYKRRKATSHTVLSKDQVSTESVNSFDAPPSVHDKVPASPLRVPPSPSRFSPSPKLSRLGSVHLSPSQVARATRNFSQSLKVGEGGFGTVYKAHLDDGQIVAIKRAKK